MLVPVTRRRPVRGGNGGPRRGPLARFGIEDAGRWSLLPRVPLGEDPTEAVARILLRRYGVVMKRLLEREGPLPPWRDLLRVYRRLEASGEIRGGRFVSGIAGEQYALPEAVGTLRDVRRQSGKGELVSVGGSDPLNLTGILTPGPRVPALPGNRVLYRDGAPLAVRAGGEITFVGDVEPGREWEARQALERHPVPPALRRYLGNLG
jgi:ATP-dependent Lhr-like helicase